MMSSSATSSTTKTSILQNVAPRSTPSLSRITQFKFCLSLYLYGSANICYFGFFSIWLSSEGFTYSEIGFVRSLGQLSILIFVPMLCLLIDLISRNNLAVKQLLLAICCIITGLSRLLFIYWEHSWNVPFCVLIVVTMAIHVTADSTMDSIILSSIPDPNHYGRYRLWYAFGWGTNAMIFGFIFDHYLEIKTMFYFFCGYMSCLGLLWLIPSLHKLCVSALIQSKDDTNTSILINMDQSANHSIGPLARANTPFIRKLCVFFGQLNLFKLQIILSIFVLGVSFGVLGTFLLLRLQEMGSTRTLMGVTLIVTMCSSIPAFMLVERALASIGDLGIICVGLMAYMLRLGWYGLLGFHGYLENPWYVMPAEALHGLTYSWIKASMAVFAHRLARNVRNNKNRAEMDLSSFSQGFLKAIFNGFGQGTAATVGGIVFSNYGPHYLFFGNALLLFPFLVVHSLQFFCCKETRRLTKDIDARTLSATRSYSVN